MRRAPIGCKFRAGFVELVCAVRRFADEDESCIADRIHERLKS
jgi:hypothetical protein